jgi:hypothetical protein
MRLIVNNVRAAAVTCPDEAIGPETGAVQTLRLRRPQCSLKG